MFRKERVMKQDCIPVGCVPPSRWPYLPACSAPGGGIPACTEADPPPPREQNITRLWKHNLAPTSLRAVKKISFVGLIKQFLRDVDWGDVDYLVIDTPPGTSDEHLSVVQYLKNAGVDGAIVITTPQVKF